ARRSSTCCGILLTRARPSTAGPKWVLAGHDCDQRVDSPSSRAGLIRSTMLRNGTQITSVFSGNMISSPWIGAQQGVVVFHGPVCTENRTDDEAPVRLAGRRRS